MTELIDIDREIEILNLRERRRNLLLDKCANGEESKYNYEQRLKIRKELFSLTNNPIYIHF